MQQANTFDPPALETGTAAIFLDFDGTLVEIAKTPSSILVPDGLEPLLAELEKAAGGALALISGRSIADIERFLPGYTGVLVGSHGAQARGMPDMTHQVDSSVIAELHRRFADFAERHGLLAEPKELGAALHFRARPEAAAAAEDFVRDMASEVEGFEVQPAHMAFELKPAGFSKDKAIAALMQMHPFAGRQPIFAGDDATDEPALKWVQMQGGIAIRLGSGASAAPYRLAGPALLLSWLSGGLHDGQARQHAANSTAQREG